MKKIIISIIIFYMMFLSVMCYAQDGNIPIDINIETIVEMTLGIYVSENNWSQVESGSQLTEEDIENLIDRLKELANLKDSELTNEQITEKYREIIKIILMISLSSSEVNDNFILQLMKLTEENSILTEQLNTILLENQKLIEENQDLIKKNEDLILDNKLYISELGLLRQNYKSMILYYDDMIKDIRVESRHTILLSPSLSLTGEFDMLLGYTTNIKYFQIGGGITFKNILNSFGFAFNLFLGFYFY